MSKIITIKPGRQELNVKVSCSNLGYSVEMSYEPNIDRGVGHHTNAQKMASIIAMRLAAFLRPENMERLRDEERLGEALRAEAERGQVQPAAEADTGDDGRVDECPQGEGP